LNLCFDRIGIDVHTAVDCTDDPLDLNRAISRHFDLGDLRRQADQMREDAVRRAEQILADARRQAGRIADQERAAARTQGHAEGLAAGLTEGRKQGSQQALDEARVELTQLRDAWIEAAHRWDAERRAMALEARQSLLELALDMARRIVHRVPTVDPAVAVDQVAAAIEHVVRPGNVAIRVNPADRPLIAEALPDLAERLGGCEHVRLIDDDAVERGGCILTHGRGVVDATLTRQLDRLVESLLPTQARDTTSDSVVADTAAGESAPPGDRPA